jgi:hypothetical protein
MDFSLIHTMREGLRDTLVWIGYFKGTLRRKEVFRISITVRKTKCDAGPNHIELSEKSGIHIDRAAESTWMTEFSVTYMFWSCATLGFSNSVGGCLEPSIWTANICKNVVIVP